MPPFGWIPSRAAPPSNPLFLPDLQACPPPDDHGLLHHWVSSFPRYEARPARHRNATSGIPDRLGGCRHLRQPARCRTLPRHLRKTLTATLAREKHRDPRRAAHTSPPSRIGRPGRTPVPCYRMGSVAASPTRQPAAGFPATHLSRRVRIFAAAASPAALPFHRTGRFRCSRASRPLRRRKSARSQETRLSAPGSARAHAGRGTPGRPPPTSCSPWVA